MPVFVWDMVQEVKKKVTYCYKCGTKLFPKELEGEGMIPWCEGCGEYRFPIFSTAVSIIVYSPQKDRILLIRQYGRPFNILVAGYINKGESAEHTVERELMEEIGLKAENIHFNRSSYFEPSNTLMLNFSCTADSDDLSGLNKREVDHAEWYTPDEARRAIKPESLAQFFLIQALKCKPGF